MKNLAKIHSANKATTKPHSNIFDYSDGLPLCLSIAEQH
jgi:hypothetical protein